MTAHSAVLCALLLCFPPPPDDGATLCPSTAPATTPAMEAPEPPPTQAPPQATDPPKAPEVGTGTGVLGPLTDCVAALEAAETEGSGGGDAEESRWVGEEPGGARGENIAPSAMATSGGGVEDGGTAEPSPETGPRGGADPEEDTEDTEDTEDERDEEDTEEENEGADATDPGAAEEPDPVATGTEPDAEPAPDAGVEAAPEPGPSPMGEDNGAPTETTLSSPTPEPRPTENGTVSRASATTRPITPAPKPTPLGDSPDAGDRPPSKKVEETEPVGGFAFEETSATSPFGRALGVTSTTVLFLLGVATLGLRLAVGWPRFPPLYLGRRRLGGDLDTR